MLHHVPTAAEQDQLFAEVARVLRPGGVLVGVDSLDSAEFRDLHVDDICNPIDPATLPDRLAGAGFHDVVVEVNPYVLQFRATA
jgi:SAM-dependent methyltransferase